MTEPKGLAKQEAADYCEGCGSGPDYACQCPQIFCPLCECNITDADCGCGFESEAEPV